MPEDIQVRTVRVEFLRAGPAHNQLLSPLTPYLAVCDDAEAGVVQMPFEQHTFERRMRAFRHQDQSHDRGERPAERDRLPTLRELGVAVGRLLGAVPRLPGSLGADPNGRDTVIRLSLTLTASELAALPFELSKVPIGPDACTENWLSVQSKVPVVITRRTRNVSNTRMSWLQAPKVLFVAAGPDAGELPFDEHLAALVAAVKPFALGHRFGQKARLQTVPDPDGLNVRSSLGDALTVLNRATLDGVVRECTRHRYTHVHILAHGGRDDSQGDGHFGLCLHPDDGVIGGDRLASALTGMVDGQLHRPQVVTLATCDSGNSSELVNPGASLAHALHLAGIPLVVASQVPLGFQASVLFAEQFYGGLLWGEHPWVLMHRVRTTLHSRLKPAEHDWASLVVYEALPSDMDDALERAAYRQCRRAVDVAHAGGRWVGSPTLDKAIDRLARHGRTHAMEARALRADTRMILARDLAFDAALRPTAPSPDEQLESLRRQRACLEEALQDYDAAASGFLVDAGQSLSAPFRTVLAKCSLQGVLGHAIDWGDWQMARVWAETVLRHPGTGADDRAWAQATLTELWLLRQLDPAGPGPAECLRRAHQALHETVQWRQPSEGWGDAPTYWLEYRLFGYVGAWSQPALRELGALPLDGAPAEPTAQMSLGPLRAGALALLVRLNALDDQMGLSPQAAASMTDEAPPAAAATPPRSAARKGPVRAAAVGRAAPLAAAPGASASRASRSRSPATPSGSPGLASVPGHRPGLAALAVPLSYRLAAESRPRPAEALEADAAPAAAPAVPRSSAAEATHAALAVAAQRMAPAATTPVPAPRVAPAASAVPPAPAALLGPAADAHFSLELLPVEQGDALVLEWGSAGAGRRWRLLVDCGTEASFKRALGPRLVALPAEQRHFELFILSHIDGDHIGGGIALLQQAKALGVSFGDIWFNGRHHLEKRKLLSGKDGDDFSQLLVREKLPWNRWTKGQAIVRPDGDSGSAREVLPSITLAGGLKLTLLSPTPKTLEQLAGTWDEDLAAPGKRRLLAGRQLEREENLDVLADRPFAPDGSRPNGSSIAVLAEFAGKRVLLGADAYAGVLSSAVQRLLKKGEKRLRLDAFKLPHHGSRGNLHDDLMARIDCAHYLVSTSGAIFSHPDREALARVVRRSARAAQLWFNYPVPERDREYHALWQQAVFQQQWGFRAFYPAQATEGLRFDLVTGRAAASPSTPITPTKPAKPSKPKPGTSAATLAQVPTLE